MVAGWKQDSSGGLKAGGRCGEEIVVPDRTEDQSLSSVYLSTGLTPWNFDSACMSFIIHFISGLHSRLVHLLNS